MSATNRRSSFCATAILKATALTCLLSLLFGCSALDAGKGEDFSIVQSRFLGSVWNEGHARASIISQDGGFSYAVPDGSLWWFGDTFKGSRDEAGKPRFSGGAVSCCVAWLDDSATSAPPVLKYLLGTDGKVAQAIPFLPEETWDRYRIWPLSGCYANGKSYIYFSLIEITGEGMWAFQCVGSGLACSDQPFSAHQRIQTADGWRFPVAPAAIVSKDDWLYLYDVEKRDEQQGVWLSRVKPEEIENPNAYEFYCGAGQGFSSDINQQTLLLKDIYGQTSVVWNECLQRYILAASSDFFHAREIRFYTAAHPAGPWREAAASVNAPEHLQGKLVELIYCSYFHPELFRDDGRVISMTFSTHLKDSGFDANNEAVEIEIEPKALNTRGR
ncbi:DUF4185 domain-containing protein [Candidatus Sumerlaeota bacterium]|nr:DUF4185 domain-containing protein [Candidatus Sumerlaeota bacterium]